MCVILQYFLEGVGKTCVLVDLVVSLLCIYVQTQKDLLFLIYCRECILFKCKYKIILVVN